MQGHEEIKERRCHICGRVFVPASHHIFHKDGKWCCKWTCYTRLLDEIEASKKKAGRPEGYSPKKKKGTFASAAGGRESEQKGCSLLLGEADNCKACQRQALRPSQEAEGASATDARCGNGNRQRKKKGEEI